MKKIYTLALAAATLLTAFPMNAELTDLGKTFSQRPRFMPERFTLGEGVQFMTLTDEENDGSCTFTIFDSKFNKLTEIKTPSYPEVTATYIWTSPDGAPFEETESARPTPERMYPRSELSSDVDAIYLTQTLFNNDELYEWIIPTFESIPVSYEEEYSKIEGNRVMCTGFKVMSENGSTVASVTYPAEFISVFSPDPEIYLVGDECYLLADVGTLDGEEYYLAYAISKTTGRLEMVGEAMKVKVSPTAPRRGTPVTVNLTGHTTGNCTVTVVSTDGRVLLSRNIEQGTTSTDINTDRFHQGMYIVNVSDGNTTHEATKIVIR